MTIRQGAHDRGFALLAAIWAALVLALIAASVMQLSWADARLARGQQQVADLGAIADAAINITILNLLGPPRMQPPVDSTPFTQSFADHEIRTTVQDEAGRIDLNMASPAVLRQVLMAVGLDGVALDEITDRILDWRERSANRHLNGAKAEDYRAAGLPYGPRNGPFRSVGELRLVLGMTPELHRAIAPMLTVYSQTAWIDPGFASPLVLELLRPLDVRTSAAMRFADDSQPGGQSPARGRFAVPGHAYTISVDVNGRGGARVNKTAVVRLTGHAAAPFWVYRWD